MPGKWWQFLGRLRPAPPARRVVVYTRADCPLCDKAAEFLERERARSGFTLQYVDIAGDATLTAQYGASIPVVEIDGKIHFRGQINPVLWRRLLHGADRPG